MRTPSDTAYYHACGHQSQTKRGNEAMLESRMLGNQHVRFGWGQSEKEQLMIPLGIQPSGSKNYRNLAGCLPNLQERRDAYRLAGKSITYSDQANQLPEIKEIREEYQEIHSQVLQDVLRKVDKAFKAFFARCKRGKTPGFPRYKGRGHYESFTYPQVGFSFTHDNRVCLSKIGSIKVKLHRPLEGKVKTCTIKREGDRWFIVFACQVETKPLSISHEDVGIDLGVMHLATLSDGSTIEHPRYYRRSEKKLSKLQQSLARKK